MGGKCCLLCNAPYGGLNRPGYPPGNDMGFKGGFKAYPTDVKVGERLPRRPEGHAGPGGPNTTTSSKSQQQLQHHSAHHYNNHKYPDHHHHPHPHTQNPYHHYKSDELLNQHYNYHSNGYDNSNNHNNANYNAANYQHGYTNYHEEALHYAATKNYKQQQPPHGYQQSNSKTSADYGNHYHQQQYQQHYQQHHQQHQQHQQQSAVNTLQQRPKSYHDLQEYHNNMKNQSDYSPDYDTYGRSHRGQRSDPHHQLSDSEITVAKARLAHLDGEHREEHLRRLAGLNHHLHDLDKQYEMGKPLINLVDNMVKLGSLYRGSDARLATLPDYEEHNRKRRPNSFYPVNGQDSLEFSRRVQERRIVAEDMREYEDASANQEDLEGKVMQLYKLDKILHEESLTIQSLQREKEMLERTLLNLNSKSHHGANEGPVELERRKKQRRHLEHELSKLRAHLAVSARKLEETAAENSRLEHEMMMLRQKIQINMERNIYRDSSSSSEARHIESEMIRVQTLLEDLQRRRIELSSQIEKLTSVQNATPEMRGDPAGGFEQPSSSFSSPTRRRRSTWIETDLDGNTSRDWGQDLPQERRKLSEPLYMGPIDYPNTPELSDGDYPPPPPPPEHMQSTYSELGSSDILSPPTPSEDLIGSRYSPTHSAINNLKLSRQPIMNGELEEILSREDSSDSDLMRAVDLASQDRDAIDNKPDGEEQTHNTSHLDINEADDRMKRYYGILPKEKPLEIKTVRIVKRESTERKKDRGPPKRVTIGDSNLTYLDEDEVDSEVGSDVENEPPVSTAIPSFAARSASLPRNYGSRGPGERVSMMAAMMRTPGSGTAGTMTRPSNLALKTNSSTWKAKNENPKDRPLSAHEQLFGISRDAENTPPTSPAKSDPPSPVFKSAAAREIIKEMATEAEKYRRAVPKEKRRHLTISSSRPLTLETNSNVEEGARSRDDCDMVRALRPRNHPDVVKSTLSSRDLRFNETTIDSIFGAPSKIVIPERYMPDEDDEKELTEAEKKKREQKADAIRKMLAQEPVNSNNSEIEGKNGEASSETKAKVKAEVKEREHILALNQILARQVMEKSRVVAVRAQTMMTKQPSSSDDDLSPMQPLPLVQQRDNFLV